MPPEVPPATPPQIRDEIAAPRRLTGPLRVVERTLLVLLAGLGAIYVLDVHPRLGIVVFREQYMGLFLALSLAATFLSTPARRGAPGAPIPWTDVAAAALSMLVGLNVAIRYPTLVEGLAFITWDKVVLGTVAILLLLEAVRRLIGWALVIITGAFILYAHFAYLFPGPLAGRGATWGRIATYLYLDTNAMLGLAFWVAASIVLPYVLLGQALFNTGGGRFFTDLAMAMLGQFRGGPGKMAVVASGFFGMISGSAVANVVGTGMITIPLMKRTGYPAHVAGAIEAVASTGGQIMPPVMGAAAFLMAEFLSIPYRTVALAAAVPACLYYVTLFIQVDLVAGREGLRGLPRAELPRAPGVLAFGWPFLVPLLVLLYTLFILYFQAGRAAMAAFAALAVVTALRPADRITPARLLGILEATGRGMLDVSIICAVAGFVIGILNLSGLAFSLSLGLVQLGGENIFLILLLSAIVCILLGMGMPTAAVYILVALMVGPALIKLGVHPLSAHLFIFYFGLMSMLTPPVCLATYAGAALAQANPMDTAWVAIKLGITAYIVPFLFIYAPALILEGPVWEVVASVVTALVGCGLISVSLVGYLFRPLGAGRRLMAGAAGLGLLIPVGVTGPIGLAINLAGLALGSPLVLSEWVRARAVRAVAAVPAPAEAVDP